MSIFEYDKEEEERKLRKAEYEYGRTEGMESGIKIGMERGRVNTQKQIAQSLKMTGMPETQISDIMNVGIGTIREWLEKENWT